MVEVTAVSERVGRVQTVRGLVEPHEVGIASTHEHLLMDMIGDRPFAALPTDPRERVIALEPVALDNLWWVRQNYTRSRANVRLDEPDVAAAELRRFAAVGGRTIVDATPSDLGRSPPDLVKLSAASDVHIVMGAGHYVASAHPSNLAGETDAEICDRLIREVLSGADGTGIRSGVIGEIGCSWPLHPIEERVLRAAGRAQRETGVSIIVHTGRDAGAPLNHWRFLEHLGVPPDRVVLGHLERRLTPGPKLRELASTGCFLALDCFGLEPWLAPETANMPMPCDLERIDMLLWLADAGFLSQVTIAQDIAMKHRLARYGGHGYDHIIRNIAPLLSARGLGEAGVEQILVETPRRILTIESY
jgi:phosphotriesterase-related protein